MNLIVGALAVYSLTYLLIDTEGPLHLFEHIRTAFNRIQKRYKVINFDCFYFLSVWVAIAIGLMLQLNIIYIMAIAGLAMIINRITERLNK